MLAVPRLSAQKKPGSFFACHVEGLRSTRGIDVGMIGGRLRALSLSASTMTGETPNGIAGLMLAMAVYGARDAPAAVFFWLEGVMPFGGADGDCNAGGAGFLSLPRLSAPDNRSCGKGTGEGTEG